MYVILSISFLPDKPVTLCVEIKHLKYLEIFCLVPVLPLKLTLRKLHTANNAPTVIQLPRVSPA